MLFNSLKNTFFFKTKINIKYHRNNLFILKVKHILKRMAFKKLQNNMKYQNIILQNTESCIKQKQKLNNIIKQRFNEHGLEIPYSIERWLNNE